MGEKTGMSWRWVNTRNGVEYTSTPLARRLTWSELGRVLQVEPGDRVLRVTAGRVLRYRITPSGGFRNLHDAKDVREGDPNVKDG